VAAWIFDEFDGRGSEFHDRPQEMGQNYVGEVPSMFTGWLKDPQILHRPTPREIRKDGRKRKFPRLAKRSSPACEVCNLAKYPPIVRKLSWRPFRIKDGEKGDYSINIESIVLPPETRYAETPEESSTSPPEER